MKNDFIRIYAAIDEKEQAAFQHYIQSFYGGQKVALAVFEEVEIAGLVSPDTLRESTFNAIRKKSTGDKNRLNAFDDLKKWLLEFLALQDLKQNTIEAKFFKLEALRKRNMVEAFQQNSKKLDIELDKQEYPNLWRLFWRVRLYHLNYFSLPVNKLQDYKPELLSLMQSLDDFYIAAKLQYSAEFYNRSKVLQDAYPFTLLKEILNLLENDTTQSPIISTLYKPMLELVRDNSTIAYNQLKEFLINHPKHDPIERQAILQYLINYSQRIMDENPEAMTIEMFELHEIGINQSIFIIAGYFSTNTFLNIVNTACFLKDTEWANNFVTHFSDKLLPIDRDDATSIALARIAFEDKKHKDVKAILRHKASKNINFELNIRLLNLRATYELQDLPPSVMEDMNENFYFCVRRSKKISESIQQKALHFHKMYRSLIAHKTGKKTKKQLLKELEKCPKNTFCYDWIKQKIEKLSK